MEIFCFLCSKKIGPFREQYSIKDFQNDRVPLPPNFTEDRRTCATCFNQLKKVEKETQSANVNKEVKTIGMKMNNQTKVIAILSATIFIIVLISVAQMWAELSPTYTGVDKNNPDVRAYCAQIKSSPELMKNLQELYKEYCI
ncbi:MAG: hypothetical protein ACREAK_08665 [Nitrosarchaeum sp.]